MSSSFAVRAESLSKRYRIGARQPAYHTLRDSLAEAARSLFRAHRSRSADRTIWALRDVSLEVPPGDVLGIIGRNGSGKSTLLKILSRITEPTEGRAYTLGRVGSLLEVGTGFHLELTGRENIYLSGAICGMRKCEIARRFDEIVAFAGTEQFVDTPVKHYSTGMYLRLAFAVAAHLEADILLVDEVLAVGDLEFQKKCLTKMSDVARTGRTVLFVSHNLGAIQRLCRRVIWLDGGKIVHQGDAADAIRRYQSRYMQSNAAWRPASLPDPARDVQFLSVDLGSPGAHPRGAFGADEPVVVRIRYVVRRLLRACAVAARVHNQEGVAVFTTSDVDSLGVSTLARGPGAYRATFTIPAGFLAPGGYSVYLSAHMPQGCLYDAVEQAVTFEVTGAGSPQSLDRRHGIVTPLLPWETALDGESALIPAPGTDLDGRGSKWPLDSRAVPEDPR